MKNFSKGGKESMANALQYVKNVGKSFGYSTIEMLESYNPQIKTLASQTKAFGSDLYQTIDDFKASMTDTGSEKGLLSLGKDSISELKKNLFEDLKSGNWYNKARAEEVEGAAVADMFGFDDEDFNLDDLDLDFSDDDFGEDNDDLAATFVEAEKESTDSIVGALDEVGNKASHAVATATVSSADFIVTSNRQSSRALYSLNQRGFHDLATGLGAINANISTIVSMGEPLTAHMQNAATFYTKSSEYQDKVLERLDILVKFASPESKTTNYRKEGTLDSILNDGVLDLSSYFDMLMGRFKDFKDDIIGMLDMLGGPEAAIKMVTASPLKFLTDNLVKFVFPTMIKNSMQQFNQHLESFFGAAIDKLQYATPDGDIGNLFDMIRDYVMPKSGYKDKIDTSMYLKGKAEWTGKDQKALRDVIPTYLAQITSAVTGKPETRYDYERGKFITISGIKNEFDSKAKRYAQSAGGDFLYDALDVVSKLGLNPEDQKKMKDQINEFFLNMFKTGKGEIMNLQKDNFEYQKYGLDDDSVKVLRDMLNSYAKLHKTDVANMAATEMRLQRDRYGDELRGIEANGGIFTSLFDNSSLPTTGEKAVKVRPGGILGVDKYNHDLFFYLQGIYQYTGHLSDNIGILGGGSPINPKGGSYRNRGKGVEPTPIKDIPYESTEEEKEKASKDNSNAQQSTAQSKAQSVYDTIFSRHEYDEGFTGQREKKDRRKEEAKSKLDADLDAGVISEEEYKEKIKELEEESSNASTEKFFKRMKEKGAKSEKLSGIRKVMDKIHGIFNKPAEVVSEILGAGEISMYHLLYGKGGDDEKGIFAYFYEKADSLFTKFDKFFEDKFDFSIKSWFKKMFGKAKDSDFVQETGEELKNAGRSVWDDVKRFTGFGTPSDEKEDNGEGETEPIDNGQAATGRKVTKTGIVAVSEGEMIIPSEYNPYYHGTNDKKTQLKNEANAIKKFYGRYARGGFAGAAKQSYDPETEEWIYYDAEGNEIGRREATEKEKLKQKGKFESGNSHGRTKRNFYRQKGKNPKNVKDFIFGSAAQLGNDLEDILKRFKPKKDEDSIIDKVVNEENRKRLKEANLPEEVVKNRGAMGAGALIGAGASILTGAVVGPLAGAAIGTGVGLVVRSEKVQKALFGEVDERTGERQGGILSKKISNFIVDQVPSIGKGAGAGAIGGLFMGSPIIGAIVGGTVGFVSSSEKAKEALFGKRDENGNWINEGLINSEIQKKVKEVAPNIGAGMIAGMIGGPFGIAGNLIVGGALGYVSTTDSFKDMLLGKKDKDGKRQGGLVGEIRTYFFGKKEDGEKQGVLTSITGIFQKVGNEISIHSRNIFKTIGKTIRKIVSAGVKSTLGQFIATSPIGKIGRAVGKGATAIAKLPFKAVRSTLSGVDSALGKRALKRGYGLLNSDGSKMTAKERLAAREDYGMNESVKFRLNKSYQSNRNLDQYLMDADETQLNELKSVLEYYEDPTKKYDNDERAYKKEFASKIEEYGISPETAVRLEKLAVGKGKFKPDENISTILANATDNKEQAQELENIFNDITSTRMGRVEALKDKDKARKDLLDKSGILGKVKGVDINSDSDIREMLSLINTEIEDRTKPDEEKDKQDQVEREETNTENITTIADVIQKIYDYITGKDDYEERVPEDTRNAIQEAMDNTEQSVRAASPSSVTNETEESTNTTTESTDNGAGETEPIGETEEAAVSEGETIINSRGYRRPSKIKNAINSIRGKFHRFVGRFAEGGIVGESSDEEFTNPVDQTRSIVANAVNLYTTGKNGFVLVDRDEDKAEVKESEDKLEENKETANTAREAIDNAKDLTKAKANTDDGGLKDSKSGIITQTDALGNIYQMKENNEGELEMDLSDSQTQQAMESQSKFKEAIYSIPLLGAGIKGISGLMGSLKSGLLGDGEEGESKSLLSTLIESLTGEDGVLSGLFSFFTNSPIGTAVSTVLSRVSLSGVLTGIGFPALIASAFTGAFDDLGASLSEKISALKGNETEGNGTLDNNKKYFIDGKEIAVDENGEFMKNEDGDYIAVDGTILSKDENIESYGTDTRISTQLKKNAILNTGGVAATAIASAGNFVKKLATGEKGTYTSSTAGKAILDASSSMANSVMATITKLLEKIPTVLSKIPFIKKWVNEESCTTICETLSKNLQSAVTSAGNGITKIAEKLGKVFAVIKVVNVIAQGIDAWGNAESILGIVDEATTGQRVIAVLIAVVNALIPVIGDLIPNKVLVNIFMEIAPKIGIDVSGLEEQREEAKAIVDQYNEETGSDLTIEAYNQMNGKAGVITKVKNWGSGLVANIKEKGFGTAVSNAASDIGTSVSNYVSDKVTNFKETFEESGLGEAVASTLDSILPGPIGDLAGNVARVTSLALSGDVSGVLGFNMVDVDENSGVLSKIINTILSTIVKIPETPIAVLFKGAHAVFNGIKSIVSKVTGYVTDTVNMMNTVKEDTVTLVNDPNSTLSDFFDFSVYKDDEDNPIGGLSKVIAVSTRISMFGQMIVSKIGKSIAEFVGGVATKIKNTATAAWSDKDALKETALSGDVSGLWSQEIELPEDTPVNGFFKVSHFLNKISYMPLAFFVNVGHKISDFVSGVADKVKTNVGSVATDYSNLKDIAESGDVSGIWDYTHEETEDSPLNGFVKAALFMNKLSFTPNALFHMVGNKISDFISPKIDTAKSDYLVLTEGTENLKSLSSDGDISGVWNAESPKFTDGGILSPLYKAIYNVQKIFYSITAIIHKIFGFISDTIGGIKDKFDDVVSTVSDTVDSVKEKVSGTIDNVKDTVSNVANGAFQSVKNWLTGSGSGLPVSKAKKYKGAGSNKNEMFVSQISDQYSSIPFGNSTVGDIGCGPAVATMIGNFEKPGSINMKTAISEAKGYEDEKGTTADYFKEVLNKRGLSSNYIDTQKATGQKDLVTDLANGKPAVLLGEDSTNDSKEASPFGPTGHYVMAKGFDDKGNIIIEDPESDTPDKAYSPNILSKVNMAVTTDQVGEENTDEMLNYVKKNGSATSGGESVPDNNITKNIWGFFTKNGFSPAATAGIMGNIYQESSMDPTDIQGKGKGPAAGLFQWENYNTKSDRWASMNNYAASKGKDWTDLDSQLEYALKEINSSDINERFTRNHSITDMDGSTYSIASISGTDAFKKETDPVRAMEEFEAAFERAGKPNFTRRGNAAKSYYNLYSGSTYTGNYDSNIGSATGGTTYGTTDSSSDTTSTAGFLGSITSAFSGLSSINDSMSSISSALSSGIGAALGETDSSTTDTTTSSGTTTSGSVAAASTPAGQGTAQSFIDIAKSQLGVTEEYDNITPYGKFTGADGAPWCASFVSWAMNKAFNGNDTKAKKALRGGYSAAVSTLWDQFKKAGAMSSTPEPGDVVIYKNNGASHTGLVETVNGDNITTIEGNTSGDNSYNRNGGMVARKSYNYKQKDKLTGFGRPDWDGAAAAGAGSGLLSKLDKATKNSREAMKVKPIEQKTTPVKNNVIKFSDKSGGASSTETQTTTTTTTSNTNNSTSTSTVVTALNTLIKLVKSLVDNTSSIPTVGTTLTNYCEASLTTSVTTAKEAATSSSSSSSTSSSSSKVSPEDDPSLQDLMNTLGTIAAG
jgi:hypothetical protein